MNRISLVFAAVLASLSSGFAVDLVDVDLVGDTGQAGDLAEAREVELKSLSGDERFEGSFKKSSTVLVSCSLYAL